MRGSPNLEYIHGETTILSFHIIQQNKEIQPTADPLQFPLCSHYEMGSNAAIPLNNEDNQAPHPTFLFCFVFYLLIRFLIKLYL